MNVSESIRSEIFAHAALEQPRECCGLIILRDAEERYVRCKNDATSNAHFVINHQDLAAAEDLGDVIAICHSHVFESPNPSEADLVECERSGIPWVIVNYPVGTMNVIKPKGYRAPLIGRQFSHGVLDCYTLIRDFYDWELAIKLPDFERPDHWWRMDGYDLYKDNFDKAGFYEIDFKELKRGDVILMQCRSDRINHGGIYLGGQVMLHHMSDRQSAREAFGGWYLKCARMYLRHERMKE